MFDRFGCVVQKDGDGGDSAQRTATYFILTTFLNNSYDIKFYERCIKNFEVEKGLYRRHPDPSKWYSRPNNFSRDQHSILNLCFAVVGDRKRLKESCISLIKRFGFHQNNNDGELNKPRIPDIIVPSQITVAIRGLGLWYLYPILFILDALLPLELLFRLQPRSRWDYDNMLCLNLMYAVKKYPTPFSKITWALYKRTDFRERIHHYYNWDNGVPELGKIYLESVRHF